MAVYKTSSLYIGPIPSIQIEMAAILKANQGQAAIEIDQGTIVKYHRSFRKRNQSVARSSLW
jgi:hypothetical protein